MAMMRLQRILAQAGIASRRAAERLILEGAITVNGRVVRDLGSRADPGRNHIKVHGKHLPRRPPLVYVVLHKPQHVLTTMADPEGRAHVAALLRGVRARVFPVGRLDADADGLVLFTNDGALAERLAHPRYRVPRVYEVKVSGIPDASDLERLSGGLALEDGLTAPARAEIVSRGPANARLRLTLYEGRSHQVKRMCAAIGHPVIALTRVAFAGISLGDLAPARYRYLTDEEIRRLTASYAAPGAAARRPRAPRATRSPRRERARRA